MSPKTYLMQYRQNIMELRRLEESIAQLQERAVSITASSEGERVQSSGNKDKIGAIVSQVADMQSERYNKMAECLKKMDEIEKTIEAVSDERPEKEQAYKTILHMRYIENSSWSEIRSEINYEKSQTYTLHGQALLRVKELLERADTFGH